MLPVEHEFRGRGVERGGILFLRPADALDMIAVCRERSTQILGIDGFQLTERATQPAMDHSIDLSRVPAESERWGLAEQFLRRHLDSGLYFEVVLDE